MAYLAVLLAKLLDPISFFACLVIAINFKQLKILQLLSISILVALATEFLLYTIQDARIYGEGLIAGIPASALHMFLAIKIANKKLIKEISHAND